MIRPSTPESVRLSSLVLAAGLALGSGASHAQRETFGDSIDVDLVELTIYVETRGGDPVTDLRREELRIEVEGEPVDVTHFASHRPDVPAPDPSRRDAPVAAPDAGHGPPIAPPEPVRYIAYVDDLNLRPHSRRRVLDQLDEFFAESLQPGDEVMVVTSSPRLRIRETFTTDHERISAVLDELDGGRTGGVLEDLERSALMQEVAHRYTDPMAAELERDRLRVSFRLQDEKELARARRSLSTLEELIGAVAGMPGRKILLHISDGLALTPTDHVLSRIAARAAASRVVLVPIDGGGAAKLDPRSPAASGAVGGFWTPEASQLRMDNRRMTLLSLAEETGGETLLLKNMDRLPAMRDDLDTYYTVAFVPPPGPVGRDRGVDIEVERRGVRVRHPRSFRIQSADERLRESLRAALAAPGGAPNPLRMGVDLGKAVVLEEGGYVLPVLVRVPLRRVTLLPVEDRLEGSVTLLWMVGDRAGGSSRIFEESVPVEIPEKQWEDARSQDAGVQVRMRLSPRVSRAALAARDDVSGTSTAVGFELNFESPAEDG